MSDCQPQHVPSSPDAAGGPSEPAADEARSVAPDRPERWIAVPVLLFIATWLTTTGVHGLGRGLHVWHQAAASSAPPAALLTGVWAGIVQGGQFSVPLMTILVCHELGHFLQARRYGVYCSLPFFIPLPLWPLGTMGAVIAMDPRIPNRKALFDIGASGPIAGMIPTLIFLVIGIQQSTWGRIVPYGDHFGEPLLFEWLSYALRGPAPAGCELYIVPMAFAGWAGLLLTTLNLFPLGHLDGGHVFYAIFGRRANRIARLLFLAIIALMVFYWKYLFAYTLLVVLMAVIGLRHPPTRDDRQPLGLARTVLGWLVLAIVPLGFTPTPIIVP